MHKLLFLIFAFFLYYNTASAQSYDDGQAHSIVLKGTPQEVYKLIRSGYNLGHTYQCQTLLTTAIKSAAENIALNDHPEYALEKIKILLVNGANYDQVGCPDQSLGPIFWAVSLPLIFQQNEKDLNDALDANIKEGTEYCDIPKVVSKPCNQITPEEREKIRTHFHENTLKSFDILNPILTKIVRILIRRGVNLTLKDERGQTVLHYAASLPKEITTEPLKLLLEQDIAVDPQNPEKHTPLFFAYGAHNQAAVNLLLDAGADPTMADKDGILPDKSLSVTLDRTSREDGSISIHLEN